MLYGCVVTAEAKIEGNGTRKDVASGLAELDRLCTDDHFACGELAHYYFGARPGVPFDLRRAILYAYRSCSPDYEEGCDFHNMIREPNDPELIPIYRNIGQ